MTTERELESRIRDAFRSGVAAGASDDLHAAAMARAARSKQRPGWLVAIHRGTLNDGVMPMPRATAAWVLLVVALTIVALGWAMVAGALRVDRPLVLPAGPGTILYSAADNESSPFYNLRSVKGDGSEPRVIREGVSPALSADGTVLMYVTGRGGADGQVAVAAGDGSSPRVLPDIDTTTIPTLAPDGTRLAWLRNLKDVGTFFADGSTQTRVGLENEVWVSPVSGEPGVRIVPDPAAPNTWFGRPVWSRDSSRIAFTESTAVIEGDSVAAYQSGLWVVNADGSDLRRLSSAIGPSDSAPTWSPDGRWIAYTAVVPGPETPDVMTVAFAVNLYQTTDLFTVSPEGGPERAITSTPGIGESEPLWSPDGRHLAYRGDGSIATMAMTGGDAIGPPNSGPLDAIGVDTSLGTWSPDGRYLLVTRSNGSTSSMLVFDPSLGGAATHLVDDVPRTAEGMTWTP